MDLNGQNTFIRAVIAEMESALGANAYGGGTESIRRHLHALWLRAPDASAGATAAQTRFAMAADDQVYLSSAVMPIAEDTM